MDVKTIEAYDKMSKEYDEETKNFWEIFPRTFIDKFANIANGKILDVGSGPGRDALILKEKGLEIFCLDASEEMIKICKQRGLQAIYGNFNKIPFQDNFFDGVWAYTSLLHVPKSELHKVMGEIRRVLKKKGILGLGLIEGEGEGYRESSEINLPRWFSFYKKEEIEKLLKEYGFKKLYFEQFKPKSKNYLNYIAIKIN